MYLGKIVGTVVSTRKDENLTGYKLLVVQKLTEKLEPNGETQVAVDTVGAGCGEVVILVGGSSSRKSLDRPDAPVDAAIVGIVDSVEVEA